MLSTVDAASSGSPRKEETLFQVIAIVLAVIAALGCWVAAAALSHREAVRGIPPDRPRLLANFSLTNCTGATISRADLDGRVLAVSFLFTGCAAICPEVSRNMAEIQRLTTNETDVRLVSVTIDPRSDTPPVLARWAARYGADTNRWFLLTGPKPAVVDLIGASFLPTNSSDPFNSMPSNFTGTDRIALVDKRGQVRIFYSGREAGTPAAVAAEIERLREEK